MISKFCSQNLATAALSPSFCGEADCREEEQVLFNAVEHGELSTIQRIIVTSPHLLNTYRHVPDDTCETPLSVAVEGGHTDLVRWLVEQGAKIRYGYRSWCLRNNKITSVLHRAAALGHIDIVRYLVELRVDIQRCDGQMRTPLYLAAQAGHLPVVRCLVEQGAYIDTPGPYNMTALFISARRTHIPVVVYLIDRGADVEIPNCYFVTPLMDLAPQLPLRTKVKIATLKLLVETGAYIDAQNLDRSVLSSAAEEEPLVMNDLLLVIYLLKRHAAVNQRELKLLQKNYPILFLAPSIFKQIEDDLLEALSIQNLPQDLEKLLFKFLGIYYVRQAIDS